MSSATSTNTTTCQSPPAMNNDVGGIGVRVSFYLQILFLATLSARSESIHETSGALSTLIATNLAMAVTALILGRKREPEISFQDGLVVFYLLAMSWVTVFCSLPAFHRFPAGTKTIKYLSVLQSYLTLGFALVILVTADQFGKSAECNSLAVVVLFRPFSALKAGRIIGWIVVMAVTTTYSVLTVMEYLPPPPKQLKQWMTRRKVKEESPIINNHDHNLESGEEIGDPAPPLHTGFRSAELLPAYDLKISGELIVKLILILILWAMAVANVELLILWNRFERDSSGQSQWQFGQVLPMFLVVLPLLNLLSTFSKYKLYPRS